MWMKRRRLPVAGPGHPRAGEGLRLSPQNPKLADVECRVRKEV